MSTAIFTRRRTDGAGHPVELRFVDMLLIIIATLLFVAVVLSVTSTFTGNGQPNAAPRITTEKAPAAIAGQPYELALSVRGGDGRYTWRARSGALPSGLTLGTDGVVRGRPAHQQQATPLTVEVTDGTGRTSAQQLAFSVAPHGRAGVRQPPPHVATATTFLDGAVEDRDYRHAFQGDAGRPPYTWAISGRPPQGLHLAPDGTLAGRPEQAGTTDFTVTMTDSGGTAVHQRVRMTVDKAPTSWFWTVLGWLKIAVTVVGYLLVASLMWTILFGSPGSAPVRGIFGRRRM